MKQGGHGGNVYKAAKKLGVDLNDVVDYSSNVSPFQTEVLKDADIMKLLSRLPEPHSETLKLAYAEKYNLDADSVCITAGTTEAIEKLCQIYAGKRVLILAPTYGDYQHYASIYGLHIQYHLMDGEADFNCDADICFICNPNNPTGQTIAKKDILDFCDRYKKTLFVVDESYMRFHPNGSECSVMESNVANLIILRSYSKTYGLPGLRMGACISANKGLIADITSKKSDWSVNCVAQTAGMELLDADTTEQMARIQDIKQKFLNDIKDIRYLKAIESDVNFFLCKLAGVTSGELFEYCLKNRILIRDCSNFYGLDDSYVRFAVAKDMSPLLKCLQGFQDD